MSDQPKQVGGGRRAIGDIAPKLAALTDDVLFDDVWNRPELSPRDRSSSPSPRSLPAAMPTNCGSISAGPSRTASPNPSCSKPSPTSPSTPAGPKP